MALQALNDLAMIRLDEDKYGLGGAKDTAESGILIAMPEKFDYFGMWSFAFEQSFMDEDKLSKLYDRWNARIGKRCFWTALSEKGNIIEKGRERFAMVKFTSLIACDDADSDARNVHSDGAGAFKA